MGVFFNGISRSMENDKTCAREHTKQTALKFKKAKSFVQQAHGRSLLSKNH